MGSQLPTTASGTWRLQRSCGLSQSERRGKFLTMRTFSVYSDRKCDPEVWPATCLLKLALDLDNWSWWCWRPKSSYTGVNDAAAAAAAALYRCYLGQSAKTSSPRLSGNFHPEASGCVSIVLQKTDLKQDSTDRKDDENKSQWITTITTQSTKTWWFSFLRLTNASQKAWVTTVTFGLLEMKP